MMIFWGARSDNNNRQGPRPERPVLPGLFAFIGLSFLVHVLLAQLSWTRDVPVVQQAERLIVSLFAPPEPVPLPPAPKPVVPRSRVAPAKPPLPPPALPAEAPPVVESPTAETEVEDFIEAEAGIGRAGEMADLVKRIQQQAAPKPEQPPLTRATPRKETNPNPQYPALARANHWQGVVRMQVAVSVEGRVERITIIKSSGYDILDDAAINAVRYWRFVPARRGDEAVADVVTVSIVLPQKK